MTALTIADIEKGYHDERWNGWGYLGGRENLNEGAERDAADHMVLAYANEHGWSYEQLFAWMNSRPGRHFADDPFHATASTCLYEITEDRLTNPGGNAMTDIAEPKPATIEEIIAAHRAVVIVSWGTIEYEGPVLTVAINREEHLRVERGRGVLCACHQEFDTVAAHDKHVASLIREATP